MAMFYFLELTDFLDGTHFELSKTKYAVLEKIMGDCPQSRIWQGTSKVGTLVGRYLHNNNGQ